MSVSVVFDGGVVVVAVAAGSVVGALVGTVDAIADVDCDDDVVDTMGL